MVREMKNDVASNATVTFDVTRYEVPAMTYAPKAEREWVANQPA